MPKTLTIAHLTVKLQLVLQLSSHEYNTFTLEIEEGRKKIDQAISQGDNNVDTQKILIRLSSCLEGECIWDLCVLRSSFLLIISEEGNRIDCDT